MWTERAPRSGNPLMHRHTWGHRPSALRAAQRHAGGAGEGNYVVLFEEDEVAGLIRPARPDPPARGSELVDRLNCALHLSLRNGIIGHLKSSRLSPSG